MGAARNWTDEAAKLEAQREKAAEKIRSQDEVVRRMNGDAKDHPEEQRLLDEMQRNKSALDFNQALFDYQSEDKSADR